MKVKGHILFILFNFIFLHICLPLVFIFDKKKFYSKILQYNIAMFYFNYFSYLNLKFRNKLKIVVIFKVLK